MKYSEQERLVKWITLNAQAYSISKLNVDLTEAWMDAKGLPGEHGLWEAHKMAAAEYDRIWAEMKLWDDYAALIASGDLDAARTMEDEVL